MDAFGVAGQGRILVAQHMIEAGAADALQGDFGADSAVQIERGGVDGLRRAVVMVAQAITSLRLAARLEPQRRHVQKLERDIVKRCRSAAFELELDFADPRRRGVLAVADVPAVDCRLDPRRRFRRKGDGRARNFGAEQGLKLPGNLRRQEWAGQRGLRVGALARDRVFPFAACDLADIAGGFNRLHKAPAVAAHAQARSSPR